MNQKQTTIRLLLGTACLIAMLAGCRQRAVVKPPQVKLATTVKETSPFDVAMEFLNNLDEYQPAQVKMQILQNLREWSRMEEAPVEWFADPMFRRLPSDLKEMFSADGLATKVFQPHDALELQQSVWLRDIAKAVALQPLADPNQREWLEQAVADGKLSSDDAEDLALACRLFDWTVRNIQLDPEEQEMDILGDERDKERRDRNTLRHQYYPWENILYGHGDWLERSRVFTLLARQFGINVVILQADRGDEPAQPWCNAAMIGEELYLFDGKLGLPLPGKDESPFGRLSDYKDAPELLEPLNETGRYRIVASDLKRMVACIDATPAALSQRMKQIESRLSGDRKLALTVAPSPIAVQLRSMGISSVEIWTFPYRGYQFLSKNPARPATGAATVECAQSGKLHVRKPGPAAAWTTAAPARLLPWRSRKSGRYQDVHAGPHVETGTRAIQHSNRAGAARFAHAAEPSPGSGRTGRHVPTSRPGSSSHGRGRQRSRNLLAWPTRT